MQFGKEKVVKCWDVDIEMSQKEQDALVNYAKANIINDKKCLLNWAVNKGLENYLVSLESKNNCLKKLIDKKSKKKV